MVMINRIKRILKHKKLVNALRLSDTRDNAGYCLKRFPEYRDEIIEYFNAIDSLKDLKKHVPEKDAAERILTGIFEKISSNDMSTYKDTARNPLAGGHKIRRSGIFRSAPSFLKPALVFVSVFVVLMLSFTGAVYASDDTVPGDTLYPVKRTAETIQVALTPYSKEGELYEEFLGKRLDEAEIILRDEDTIEDAIADEIINDIDFAYDRCRQHNCFGENESYILEGQINTITENIQHKRYSYRHGQQQDSGNDQQGDQNNYQNQNSNGTKQQDQGSTQQGEQGNNQNGTIEKTQQGNSSNMEKNQGKNNKN